MINESHYASDLIRVSVLFIAIPCFRAVFVIVEWVFFGCHVYLYHEFCHRLRMRNVQCRLTYG